MLHFIPLLLVLRMLKQTNDPLEVIVASEADNDLPCPTAVAADLDWCTQLLLKALASSRILRWRCWALRLGGLLSRVTFLGTLKNGQVLLDPPRAPLFLNNLRQNICNLRFIQANQRPDLPLAQLAIDYCLAHYLRQAQEA